ncbi:MAG: hypothetical protein AMXMBFR57_06830 [Acidimicrobiia bacterium]
MLIAVKPAAVMPVAVRIGPAGSKAADEYPFSVDGRLIRSGVPAAEVAVIPLYEGGLAGQPQSIAIEPERSTALTLEPADVGQLRIQLQSELCGYAGTLDVLKLGKTSTGMTSRSRILRRALGVGCEHVVGGLTPGDYEVRASGGQVGFVVTRAVAVESQVEHAVSVSMPAVSISGTVLLNGRPYTREGLTIRFSEPDAPPTTGTSATILGAGAYSAWLSTPGTYVARLTTGDLALTAETKTVSVVEGQNYLDWSFEGGTLTVSVEGWNQASPVNLTFQQIEADGSGVRQTNYTLRPPADSRLNITGLAAGTYILRAQQELPDRSVLTSSPKEVRVEADRSVETSIGLESYSLEVLVQDTAGQPIADAVVRTQHSGALMQPRPGVFQSRAGSVSSGDSLLVLASGYAARCIVASGSNQLVVVLTPAPPTTVEVHSSARYGVVPGFVTSPSSSCPIELMALPKTALGVETRPDGVVVSRFLIENLPPVEELLYATAPRAAGARLTRDDRGVVVITVR